ncbi:hypothetical protein HYW74_00785 [Candidatus Pacearchaeota archaeon]|nr:hypothetical protein [Candidatus Pacearchaeota archaeon]
MNVSRREFLEAIAAGLAGFLLSGIAVASPKKQPKILNNKYEESVHCWTVLEGDKWRVEHEIPMSGEYCGPEIKITNYKTFSPTKKEQPLRKKVHLYSTTFFSEGGLEEAIEIGEINPNSGTYFAGELYLVLTPSGTYCRFYNTIGRRGFNDDRGVETYDKSYLDVHTEVLNDWQRVLYNEIHLTNSDIENIKKFRQKRFEKWKSMFDSLTPGEISQLSKDHPLLEQIFYVSRNKEKLGITLFDREFETVKGEKNYDKFAQISKRLSERTTEDEFDVMINNLANRFCWPNHNSRDMDK